MYVFSIVQLFTPIHQTFLRKDDETAVLLSSWRKSLCDLNQCSVLIEWFEVWKQT